MRIVVGDILVECVQSDVDHQSDVAALFYYTSKSGEIAAGQEPLSKSELRPGQALLEQLPGFSGRYRIIASGPDSLDDRLAVEVFKCCLANAVALCENHEVRSVAFPLAAGMSKKIPIPLAAQIAAAVVADHARRCRNLRVIRFALASALELNTLPRYLIQAAATLAEPRSVSI
ncbi:hypothetical protein [Ciceribacter sp. T2.26MG-112.2]|uniref:hypothetical protein n=1 Tax=Ciceribacter sp. T2.26MG-112.2 TaxID=3137154 RepID=UPI0012B68ACD|nr:hypothetical protein [Ciceribacter naphthalenivorans]